MSELIIRPETPDDYRATECMVQRTFWNIHCPGCNEHVLVLFVVDTVCLALLCRFIFGGFTDSILDLVMHGWVIYELLVGLRAARRLQSDV